MAACQVCGGKLGFSRRLAGRGECESCEQRRLGERAQATDELRAAVTAVATTGDSWRMALVPAIAERAGTTWTDLREMKLEAIREMARTAVEDELLSEEEERRLENAATSLELKEEDFLEALGPYGTRILIARAAAGRLPVEDRPSILLKPGEIAHLEIPAGLMKEVVHREMQGGSTGISIPIAKGVRVRTASYRGRSVVVGTSMVVVDSGTLTITTQRAVFKGARQSVESSFAKLLGVNVLDDGIQFHVSNRKIAPLFKVPDGYLVAAIVNAVIQKAA